MRPMSPTDRLMWPSPAMPEIVGGERDVSMSVDLHDAVDDEHGDRHHQAKVESPEKRRRHGGEKERKLAPLGAR